MFSVGEGLLSAGDAGLAAVSSRGARGVAMRAAGSAVGRETADTMRQTGGTGGGSTARPDDGVSAYQQTGRKLAAAAVGGAAATNDPQAAKELAQLKAADVAVRAHEAAHVAAGGGLVRGGATFTYETGPDGRQYAVAGEVQIDTAPVRGDPEATIQKMATVRAAALAPSDPSATDRAVAASAAQQALAARAELSRMESEPDRTESAPGAEGPSSRSQWGAWARATYAAANEPRSEPGFVAVA